MTQSLQFLALPWIVRNLEIFEYVGYIFSPRYTPAAVDSVTIQLLEEALNSGTVERATNNTHVACGVVTRQELLVLLAGLLPPGTECNSTGNFNLYFHKANSTVRITKRLYIE